MTLVTRGQVRQAVEALSAQGRVPTPKSISDYLGGKYSVASIKARLTALAKEASQPVATPSTPPAPVRRADVSEENLIERLRLVEFALYRLKEAFNSEHRENEKLRERLADCQDDLYHAEMIIRIQQSEFEAMEANYQRLQETAPINEAQRRELYLLRAVLADLVGKRLAYKGLRIQPTALLWPECYPLTPENPTIEHPVVVTALHNLRQYEEKLKRDYGDKQTQVALLAECEDLKLKLAAQEYISAGIRVDLDKCRQRLFALTQKKPRKRTRQTGSSATEKIDSAYTFPAAPPETKPWCGFWRFCNCRYGVCDRGLRQLAPAIDSREQPSLEHPQCNDDEPREGDPTS